MIPIYKPYLPKHTLRHAHDAIDSTWLSSKGKYIDLAEESLREITGAEYIQLVNNGTSATHLAVKALLYNNPAIKQVITPNNVYVAAWNSIVYEGLEVKPVDANINTWNIDLDKIPADLGNDTAIMLVHNVGNIVDINKIKSKYKNTLIIEDNCEGFMGKYGNDYSGTKSLASSLSFFGNKTITSGEGGAFTTNDKDTYEFIKSSHGQGQKEGCRYIHDKLGYNYRMTNIQAALLLGQFECLQEILEKKEKVFNYYNNFFKNNDNVFLQETDPDTSKANWVFALRTNKDYSFLEVEMMKKKIETRSMFFPISAHEHLSGYADRESEEVANLLNRKCIMLPSFPSLQKEELEYICTTIANLTKV